MAQGSGDGDQHSPNVCAMFITCRYGTGNMTRVFVDRLFQECLTYEGEVVRSTMLLSREQSVLHPHVYCRTIRPTWTLCWPWKTEKSHRCIL